MARHNEYDAIVVGSGITGGWAAKELAEKGLKVLLLERGGHVEHGKGYVSEHVPPWEMRFRERSDRRLDDKEYVVQKQCYALGDDTRHFFVNDKLHPYKQAEGKPFAWIRGYHLGGRSLTWFRLSYRWGDLDFEGNARDGHGVDWPVRYRDLAPWYDYVEEFVGVSGQAEGLPQLPDGRFQPPMAMNCAELAVKERLAKAFPDRTMTIGRTATLTRPLNGRTACHYCVSACHRGCSTGSYFSSLAATLPAATVTGNLEIRPHSIVHSVAYDEKKDKATGVPVIDQETPEALEFKARVIFLCASTLGSTQILLGSSTRRFPNGLANSSGALGHYLMDHAFSMRVKGVVPGLEEKYYSGHRPNVVYVPRFQNLVKQDRDYLRGYGLQGGASRESWERGFEMPGFGADFKRALRDPGPWTLSFTGFGECLPRYDNYVELDSEIDSWGLPLLKVHCTYGENEKKMTEDVAVVGSEMLEAAGVKDVTTTDRRYPPGLGIHEMGTARMGKDPKTSVLNGYNQCHDVPNVFVTDGAAMASSACQNPSLTYMAFTARACDYAVREMKRGNL
jgi:choline dehydrogenase-like flavoprotein